MQQSTAVTNIASVFPTDPAPKSAVRPSAPSAEAKQRIQGLEQSMIPVCVFDFDAFRITWANEAALQLWGVTSFEALYAREFSNAPPSVITRIQSARSVVTSGRSTTEQWTLYPGGVPTLARIHLSPIELENKRIGVLQQFLVDEPVADVATRRASEALLHTSALVSLVTFEGIPLYQNPASQRVHKETDLAHWFVDDNFAENALKAARAGTVTRCEALVRIGEAEIWHEIEARPVRDPVSSEMAVLFQLVDESARIAAQRDADDTRRVVAELELLLATISRQQEEIFALSTPLLAIGRHVVAVPIIGAFTAERIAELACRLLHAVAEESAHWILLDFTGMSPCHARGLKPLGDVIQTIRPLGARVILSGIGQVLNKRLADEGFVVADLPVYPTLADSLASIEARDK
jgi:anti-anti-sigma regulatory factor/PAS domain-containing protein